MQARLGGNPYRGAPPSGGTSLSGIDWVDKGWKKCDRDERSCLLARGFKFCRKNLLQYRPKNFILTFLLLNYLLISTFCQKRKGACSFCQLGILSTWHFVNSAFCQTTIIGCHDRHYNHYKYNDKALFVTLSIKTQRNNILRLCLMLGFICYA